MWCIGLNLTFDLHFIIFRKPFNSLPKLISSSLSGNRKTLWAFFNGDIQSSSDRLPSSHKGRNVPTPLRRVYLAVIFFLSISIVLCYDSFCFCFVHSLKGKEGSTHLTNHPDGNFHLSAGMKGSRGGAPPSSRLARRRRGLFRSCHTLVRANTVWLNNNNNHPDGGGNDGSSPVMDLSDWNRPSADQSSTKNFGPGSVQSEKLAD